MNNNTPPTGTPHTIITRKIGANRGKARLWIEGPALTSQGWTPGKPFSAHFRGEDPDNCFLQYWSGPSTTAPPRKVAGDTARPIIDTNTDKLLTTLGVEIGDTVTIVITPAAIIVRKAAA